MWSRLGRQGTHAELFFLRVLDSLAPGLLDEAPDSQGKLSRATSDSKYKPTAHPPFTTLREALDKPESESISLRSLRQHTLDLRSQALERPELQAQQRAALGSHAPTATGPALYLTSSSLLLGLLDELARSYRSQPTDPARQTITASLAPASQSEGGTANGVKKEEEQDLLDEENEAGKERYRKYALHMRLPSGDYFTNAVHIDQDKIATLQTGQADLVAVAPAVAPPLSLAPDHLLAERQVKTTHPTLGERVYKNASTRPPRVSVEQMRALVEHKVVEGESQSALRSLLVCAKES